MEPGRTESYTLLPRISFQPKLDSFSRIGDDDYGKGLVADLYNGNTCVFMLVHVFYEDMFGGKHETMAHFFQRHANYKSGITGGERYNYRT